MQNNDLKGRSEKKRIHTLDALRGLAAITVVLSHTLRGFLNEQIVRFTNLYILRSGHEAVLFFFILSGYVLVYNYRSNPNYTYSRFLTHRFFRVYVPYIVAIAFTIVLMLLSKPVAFNPDFVSGLWHSKLTFKMIVKHIILIGNYSTGDIDPVIWSLVHEMRFALLFPILLYVIDMKIFKVVIVILLLILTSGILIGFNLTYTLGYLNSYGHTVYYFYMFVLGGLIARYKEVIINDYNNMSELKKTIGLIIAILIYNYSNLLEFVFDDLSWPKALKGIAISYVTDLGAVIASCYFIIVAISVAKNKGILTRKLPLFLGKISYSLYLVHLPVTTFIYFKLYGKIPTSIVLSIGVLVSFMVAIIFNKYIENRVMGIVKKIKVA